MSQTYPTRMLTIVDIPEPQGVQGKFQYNFFTTDERTNNSGDRLGARAVDYDDIIDLIDDVPRFVRITWKPVNIKKCWTSGNEFRSRRRNVGSTRRQNRDIFSKKNLTLIQTEQTFSNFDFAAINFQDSGIDGKLFNLISGSANLRGISEGSLSDAAKTLNDFTRESVNGQTLIEAIDNQIKCGILSVDPGSLEVKKTSKYEELKELSLHTQVNNKVVGTIVRSVAEDSLNLYADEMSRLIRSAEELQEAAIERLESTSVSSLEWDSGFIPIIQERVGPNIQSHDVSDIEIVGYIVNKTLLGADGREIPQDPIVVKGNQATSIVDAAIVYGGIYKYTVSAVASVTLLAKDAQGRKIKATGLVMSQSPPPIFVNCIDLVPPPPPADFRPTWDYSERSLRLLWSFPVDRQRDIKYFRIFRRSSIDEPYELLREFDFDDSLIIVNTGETIDDNLTFKMSNPRTYFYDREFTKDSTFIYTLCSVDAHGFSSNYATQYEVKFNRFTNKIEIKAISKSGAPLAYPNMYLRTQTFLDTIKTSGFSRMTAYFDPEYLKVLDSNGSDLDVLPLDDQYASYKLQIINTDFQASQTVDFTIDDRRKVKDTSKSKGARLRRKKKLSFIRELSGLRSTR